MEQPTCKGITAEGETCKRTTALDNGYCYQHLKQAIQHNPLPILEGLFASSPFVKSGTSQNSNQHDDSSSPDDRNEYTCCQGITAEGEPCKRTTGLTQGWCYQHFKSPSPAVVESPFASSPFAVPFNTSGGHNSNNDSEGSPAQLPVVAAGRNGIDSIGISRSGSSVSSVSNSAEAYALPCCAALARSTGRQCRKRVSFLGQKFCPMHGGKQIKPVSLLPMCGAIANHSRQPCKNQVSALGQAFCTVHGGHPRSTRILTITQPPPLQQVPQVFAPMFATADSTMAEVGGVNDPRCWADIQASCDRFLLDIHPQNKCKCNSLPDPCQSMKIVLWAEKLTQTARYNQHQLFHAKPSELTCFVPRQGELFSDLYAAVEIFGANIFFLPRFYQHLQSLVQGKQQQEEKACDEEANSVEDEHQMEIE